MRVPLNSFNASTETGLNRQAKLNLPNLLSPRLLTLFSAV